MKGSPSTVDRLCEKAIINQNMLVPWFLISSYAYYELDRPVISDRLYDEICEELLECWDDIGHEHKHLIDHDALRSGTGFYLKNYPGRVKGSAELLIAEHGNRKKGRRARAPWDEPSAIPD